ncbi:MAG TPA: FtsX-like permease family protein [Gemmatimonadaceae bacterium]|nr:FtsX-like permease family protein [Gemmatimonadaceae bacterium]
MILTLARASLSRRRTRTALAVVGVAVSAALLLDMVMLSSGMRESFRSLLEVRGFELRLAPKGTLPFDTEATIDSAAAIMAQLRANPDIVTVSPVLGGQLHVQLAGGSVAAVAIGIDPTVQGDYEPRTGRDIRDADDIVVSDALLAATGAHVGDTLRVAGGYDAQLRAVTRERRLAIVGTAHFIYTPANPKVLAMRLQTLRAMTAAQRDPVSLFMLRLRPGADADSVERWVSRAVPRVTAISTAAALRQVDERLSYFRQLAFILGSVSLAVGLLLVTTLVTVSVNERLGEIAVMRAIGVSTRSIIAQVMVEGVVIMLAGSVLGLGLGLVTAHYLNGILAEFPGLPAAIDFFLFEPRDAWVSLGLLAVSGVLAGIYPAWRGASLPIAVTLREEAVA